MSSSTGNKKKLTTKRVSVTIGCSFNVQNLSRILNFKPKTPETCYRSNKFCPNSSTVRGFGRVGGESVAVEKESDDPYLDFRHSMLHMILMKQIYSKDDMMELLKCFLELNAPFNHGIINTVFREIWDEVFSVKSGMCKSRDPKTLFVF